MIRRTSIVFMLAAIAAAGAATHSASAAAGDPTITRAVTGDDGDGSLDSITLTFSSVMDPTTPSSGWFASDPSQDGFYVEGYTIAGAQWASTGATNTTLKLILQPKPILDTGATPIVRYKPVAGGPRSSVTSAPLAPTEGTGVAAFDGAGPVIAWANARDLGAVNLFNQLGDQLVVGFSEPVLLAGAAHARPPNLENALRFSGVAADGVNGCPLDGAALSNQNLPQRSTGEAPIQPDDPATASPTLTVTLRTDNIASVQRFAGVPKGCVLSIDPSNNSVITDALGNTSRPYNAVAGRSISVRITPMPISLVSAATIDGVGSVPDGVADGIRLTFDQRLSDLTTASLSSAGTVTVAGTAIPAGTVQTGATPNDEIIELAVALPATAPADSITVAYAAPTCTQAPSGTTTTGASGPVPYGAGFVTCVASYSRPVTDGVGPAVLSATTIDPDTDGRIDGVDVLFSEPIATSAAGGWTLGEKPITSFTVDPGDAARATLAIEPGTQANGGETPSLIHAQGAGVTADAAGNEVPAATWTTSDGVGPAIVAAVAEDTDGNGHIDSVNVTLSEPATSNGAPVLTFGSVAADAVAVDQTSLVATFSGDIGSAARALTISSGIADANGVAVPADPYTAVVDQAAPVGEIAVSPSAPIPAGDATVRVIYSEGMRSDALTVTMGSTAVPPVSDSDHTAEGWRTDDPSVWEGAIAIEGDACGEPAGCPVTLTAAGGRDLAGLAPITDATLETLIDVIAPDPAAVSRLSGLGTDLVPDGYVNGATTNLRVSVDVPAGQADEGTLEVLIDGASMNTPLVADVTAGATSVQLDTTYETIDAFRGALGGEGEHEISAVICDTATNCATGSASTLIVDTIGVPVSIGGPSQDEIVSGGSSYELSWATTSDETAAIGLAFSPGGDAWVPITLDLPTRGAYEWRVPAIDAAGVRVEAISFDPAMNIERSVAAGALTIDSSKPVIGRLSVPKGVNSGARVRVTWTVTDLTIAQARNPIRLAESIDGGKHWRAINGGKASTVNDGRETWRVPRGAGRILLRLTATDATGKRSVKTVAVRPR